MFTLGRRWAGFQAPVLLARACRLRLTHSARSRKVQTSGRCSGEIEELQARNLKLNETNMYLSWTRNCLLCTVLGAAIYEQKELFRQGDIAARIFLSLGFLNLTFGSYQHLDGVYRYRRLMRLSRAAIYGISAYTTGGVILWVVGIAVYLS